MTGSLIIVSKSSQEKWKTSNSLFLLSEIFLLCKSKNEIMIGLKKIVIDRVVKKKRQICLRRLLLSSFRYGFGIIFHNDYRHGKKRLILQKKKSKYLMLQNQKSGWSISSCLGIVELPSSCWNFGSAARTISEYQRICCMIAEEQKAFPQGLLGDFVIEKSLKLTRQCTSVEIFLWRTFLFSPRLS